MTAELIASLGISSLATSAAILLVLGLRKGARRWFGARAAYRLWLAAPFAAAMVLLPRREVLMPAPAAPVRRAADVLAAGAIHAPDAATGLVATAAPISLAPLALGLWLAGAAAFLMLSLLAHRRGVASFGQLKPDGGVLRASKTGLGPALLGGLRPKVVLPADFESRFQDREQALVLAHERAHLAAGDPYVNTFLVLFTSVNWFNPLVHLAARLVRVDQELACDAAVLQRFPAERRLYAQALLKTQLIATSLPLGCYWPGRSSAGLAERIAMLGVKTSRGRRLAGAAALVLICGGAGLAAWAAEPPVVKLRPATVSSSPAIDLAPVSPRRAPTAPKPKTAAPDPLALQRAAVEHALASGDLQRALDLGATAQDIAGLALIRSNPALDASSARFIREGSSLAVLYVDETMRYQRLLTSLRYPQDLAALPTFGDLVPGARLVPLAAPRLEQVAIGRRAMAGASAQETAGALLALDGGKGRAGADPASAVYARNSRGELAVVLTAANGQTQTLAVYGAENFPGLGSLPPSPEPPSAPFKPLPEIPPNWLNPTA